LSEQADAFIILPGKSGTLAELAFLWALDRTRLLHGKPVVLCGGIWPALVEAIERAGALDPEQKGLTAFCGSPQEAVSVITRRIASAGPNQGEP